MTSTTTSTTATSTAVAVVPDTEGAVVAAQPEQQHTKLFVGQVPSVCSEENLRPVFAAYGTIVEISIMRDRYGKSKGCAWVTYSTRAEADAAVQDLHDKHCIPPQTNPLQVRLASTPPMHKGGGNPAGAGYVPHHNHMHHHMQHPHDMGFPPPGAMGFPMMGMPGQGWGMPHMLAGGRGMGGGVSRDERPRPNLGKGGRKVFVGQLGRDVTDADLRALMEPHGAVEEIIMLRDRAAFVIFETKEGAQKALETLRAETTMNVRLADGEGEEDECKLFVGMIAYEADEATLEPIFSPFGTVTEIVVLRQNGRSRGAAFVRYENKESASAAIAALNGKMVLPGSTNPLVVQVASAKKVERAGIRARNYMLEQMHMQMQLNLMGAMMGGLAVPIPAAAGMRGMGGRQMGGGSGLSPRYSVPKPECGPKGANLFVRNLPAAMQDSDLERLFRGYGAVVSATIFRDRMTGCSRGFGFVSFVSVNDATQAVRGLNGTVIHGHTLQVQVKNGDNSSEGGDDHDEDDDDDDAAPNNSKKDAAQDDE
eukprot:PhM_4_TR4173/c0_g2_i1/m.78488/K13207/CUGBP, BRUNOL, CELF; CUG-BP- and ETR3-like factor